MDAAEARISSLPKWAQEYVAALQRRADSAERELAEVKQGPVDSNVFRVWGLVGDDQPLGKDCEIRFQFGEQWSDSITVRHNRQGDGNFLHVNGNGTLHVEPRATNDVRIHLIER
jgi:hypothetical protein